MSSRKMLTIVILTNFCMLLAVNVFGQAQPAIEKKSDEESAAKADPAVDITIGQPYHPHPSTGTTTVTTQRAPAGVQRVVVTQNVPEQVEQAQRALKVAEEELQKVRMELEKTLKELEKSGNQPAVQKAREELQKAMQKAQDEMQKAKAKYDKTAKDYLKRAKEIGSSLQAWPTAEADPFAAGGVYGRSTGGGYGGSFGGGYGFSGGKIVMDNRTGQMIIKGPASLEIITGPEAKELREKEEKIVADIGELEDQYSSSKDKDERAKMKSKLTELVGEQFNIRQQYREMQVKRLEKELAEIRESIQKRSENREQIVKRRIAQLLNEQDDLEF